MAISNEDRYRMLTHVEKLLEVKPDLIQIHSGDAPEITAGKVITFAKTLEGYIYSSGGQK